MAADISIIIPAYNYAHYLSAAVHSVLIQSTPDMSVEIIVIDDGSTDDTPAVAASFGKAIRYVRQENQGLSAARNTGLSLAAGELLVFLDADDLLTPGMLASQANALRASPDADIVICHNQMASSATPDSPLYSAGIWLLFKDNLPIHLCQFNIAPPHAWTLRRRVAERVGGFDPSLKACEDHDYWLRCVAAGFKPAVNPEALVIYRKHAGSMSAQAEKQLLHDALLHERVARLLSENTSFLHDRREDAFMAHASGCLITAAKLTGIRPGRALELLDLGCLAIKQAARERAMNPRRAPGGNKDTRTESDKGVLHAYALKALEYINLFNTISHAGLHEAFTIWNSLYPHWGAHPDRVAHELWQRLYVPQTLVDIEGLAPPPVRLEGRARKRVLLGSDFFWPSVGGCELFIEDLGRQLIGAGYEVHHVCRHLPERASLTHEGIHIAPFDCTGRFCDRAFGPGYEAYKNFLSSARYEAAFFIGQPDIWLMAPLLENPVPHTRCCLIPIINTMLLDEWRSRNEFELVAAVLRNASLCIALTEAGMDHQFLKKIAANTCFLPHAIPAYPEMPDFRMRHELASDIPLIVHVGNYWPLKNQLSLLEQLRPLAGDWQLALIGHQLPWPEESRYYDMVAALAAADPRVRPLGGLVAPEADAAIAAADVFVLPSKAEARPLVILQAMRHGIPWVATPECNSVHDDAGGVVAPLEHFSAVIRTLLDNPDYREALGALGRRHWQECCSWGVILPRFLEILAEGRPAVDLVMPPNLRKNNDRLRQRILSASNLACASG